MKGIEGTKLYIYMMKRSKGQGIEPLENRVRVLYLKLYHGSAFNGRPETYSVMRWLKDAVTIEQLKMEFNEHELMELLLP